MELEASHKKILEYLDEHGPVNTFRLSKHLEIDRNELINIIKDLTKKRLVEFKRGSVSINEKRYQKITETKEEKPAGLSKPQPIPEIAECKLKKIAKPKISKEALKKSKKGKEKSKLGKEKKSEGGIDTNIEEIAKDIKKQEIQFREREKKGERAVKSIDEEFEKLEEKPKKELKIVKKAVVKPKKPKKKKELQKEKIIKEVKHKKKAKKVKTRRRLSKERHEELNQWVTQRKLDIEKLKIDIKLLSLSSKPEDNRKLRDSVAKLRDMINQKIREVR